MNLVGTILARLLDGFVEPFLRRAWLAIENRFRSKPSNSEKRFFLVLCWLDNDPQGHGTKVVARAFTRVSGIKLVRSARIIAEAAPWTSGDRRCAKVPAVF